MPTTVAADLVKALQETNARLRFSLDRLVPDSASPETPPRPATPQQMAELLSELMKTGHWLRTLPEEKDPALELELCEYRRNVERLRALLPLIHDTLLHERSRLEQERARVTSAAQWACRSRQTL